jgi:hypothetical protein
VSIAEGRRIVGGVATCGTGEVCRKGAVWVETFL